MTKEDLIALGWKSVYEYTEKSELWLNPNSIPMWIYFKDNNVIDITISNTIPER